MTEVPLSQTSLQSPPPQSPTTTTKKQQDFFFSSHVTVAEWTRIQPHFIVIILSIYFLKWKQKKRFNVKWNRWGAKPERLRTQTGTQVQNEVEYNKALATQNPPRTRSSRGERTHYCYTVYFFVVVCFFRTPVNHQPVWHQPTPNQEWRVTASTETTNWGCTTRGLKKHCHLQSVRSNYTL